MHIQAYSILLLFLCMCSADHNCTEQSYSKLIPLEHTNQRRSAAAVMQYNSASTAVNARSAISNVQSSVSSISQSNRSRNVKNVVVKQKRERYRCLRKAMREIRWFLESSRVKKGNQTRDDVKGQKCRNSCKWKKRFSIKWKRLNARVKKLEAWRRKKFHAKSRNEKMTIFDTQTKGSRSTDKQHRNNGWIPSASPMTAMDRYEREPNLKILFSSVNKSLNGDYGRPCTAHRDCKAGLCCHRYSGNVTVPSSICILYKLRENDLCKDTCQCEAHLHCILSSSPSSTTNNSDFELGVCKKVSKINFGNGKYLDAKTLVFSD